MKDRSAIFDIEDKKRAAVKNKVNRKLLQQQLNQLSPISKNFDIAKPAPRKKNV